MLPEAKSILLDPLHGNGYQFYSGIGSSLNEWVQTALKIAVGVGVWARHHNCHEHGCLRPGWRKDGDDLKCKVHHPDHPALGWFRSNHQHPRHRRQRA